MRSPGTVSGLQKEPKDRGRPGHGRRYAPGLTTRRAQSNLSTKDNAVSTAIPVPEAAPQAPQPAQAPQAPQPAQAPLAGQAAQAPLLPQAPQASQDKSAPRPPEDIARSLFVIGRRVSRRHPLLADTLLALAILAFATLWLSRSPFASPRAALVQAALIAPVAVRRVRPTSVFACLCAIALAQW